MKTVIALVFATIIGILVGAPVGFALAGGDQVRGDRGAGPTVGQPAPPTVPAPPRTGN